ncbi:MAG: hypothetical protein AAF363_04885 [Bacteroidota bacterium]
MKHIAITLLYFQISFFAKSQEAVEIRRFEVSQSKQAVAVDQNHFYVINNTSITKHSKKDGKETGRWSAAEADIQHLNSGIIMDNKLYCANSNYPESPMASSVEIFDPVELEHIGNRSFGIGNGSLTWVDQKEGFWWAVFAHYTGRGAEAGKDNSWTRLVKYDLEWRQLESWIFPKSLLERFNTRSNSGGLWVGDQLYLTGHDAPEIYIIQLPKAGYELEWIKTIPVNIAGQGIALDQTDGRTIIYGILRKDGVVTVSEVK